MPWISITLDTLRAYLVGAQLDAVETAALSDGQTSPFAEVAPGVIARIRAEIASCTANVLDPDESKIPESLKGEACALIVEAMQPRLLLALTEDQRRAADAARAYLRRIAACEVRVPDVAQAGTFQSAGGFRQVSGSPRLATRKTLQGL